MYANKVETKPEKKEINYNIFLNFYIFYSAHFCILIQKGRVWLVIKSPAMASLEIPLYRLGCPVYIKG